MLIAIAAVGIDGTIGIDDKMPWHIKEDLKHFKETTIGHTLIVGRNTYESLPNAAFNGRTYIVLSKNKINNLRDNACQYMSIDELLSNIDIHSSKKIFVAGGSIIYDSLLIYCSEAIITWVKMSYNNANKFFPIRKLISNFAEINPSMWKESKCGIEYRISYYGKTKN